MVEKKMANIKISDLDSSNANSFITDITDDEYLLIAGGGFFGSVWKGVKKIFGFVADNVDVNVTIGNKSSKSLGGGGDKSIGSNVQLH